MLRQIALRKLLIALPIIVLVNTIILEMLTSHQVILVKIEVGGGGHTCIWLKELFELIIHLLHVGVLELHASQVLQLGGCQLLVNGARHRGG